MEEKKEHHLTRAKRLREEALAQEGSVDSVAPDIVSDVAQGYNIYSARAELVGYAKTEKEANEELEKFVGGWKKLI